MVACTDRLFLKPYEHKALDALEQSGLERKRQGRNWYWQFEKVPSGRGKLTWEEFRELYKDDIFRLNLAKRFLKETEEVNGNRYLLGMSSYSYFHRIQILRYAQNNSEGGKSVTLDVVRGLRNPHFWLASPIIFALPLHTSP